MAERTIERTMSKKKTVDSGILSQIEAQKEEKNMEQMQYYDLTNIIKDGLIDKEIILDFNVDEYYKTILNKKSDMEEQNK